MSSRISIPFPDYPFSRRSNKDARREGTEKFRSHVRISLGEITPTDGFVSIRARFYTDSEGWDIDNLLKPLLDALSGTLYKDDNQVVEIHAHIIRGSKKPRIECEWEFLEDDKLSHYFVRKMREAEVPIKDVKRIVDKAQD